MDSWRIVDLIDNFQATQEMTLMEVLDMIIDNSISGVPIVDESTMKVRVYIALPSYIVHKADSVSLPSAIN